MYVHSKSYAINETSKQFGYCFVFQKTSMQLLRFFLIWSNLTHVKICSRYLADNLQDDSIDVIYESGADLDRLRQLVPTNVRKYKVRNLFQFFSY